MNAFSLEVVIATRPHLLLATEYLDKDPEKEVHDTVDVTLAALALWRVLIPKERTLVAITLDRVSEMIGARKSDKVADALLAPRENARYLNEGTSAGSNKEYASVK